MSSVGSTSRAFVAKSSNNFVEANITPFHDGADSNDFGTMDRVHPSFWRKSDFLIFIIFIHHIHHG